VKTFLSEYEKIIRFLTEADGGVDVLPDDEVSELGVDVEPSATTREIDLTQLLLNAFRFKPTKEFSAYVNMPRFHNLNLSDKVATIRNVINKHQDRLVMESEDLVPEDPAEFGEMESDIDNDVDIDDMDFFRLIMRALNTNPHLMTPALSSLPTTATADNYESIINSIENALF